MSMSVSMSMPMAMTFSPWSEYRVSILFDSWTTSTLGEFVLAWFLVVLATITYHALRFLLIYTESVLKNNSKTFRLQFGDFTGIDESTSLTANDNAFDSKSDDKRLQLTKRERIRWRILHAMLSSGVYAVSCILLSIRLVYVCSECLFLCAVSGRCCLC